LVGFGVDGEDTGLLLLAGKDTDLAKALWSRLQDVGIRATLRTEVSFVAAGARPVKGGQSLGHGVSGGETGTMGCVVKDRSSGSLFALTCNHVIADLNNATKGTTAVWAPGAKQTGTASDKLGVVHDFADLDFTPGVYNIIDAALAKPDNASDVNSAI